MAAVKRTRRILVLFGVLILIVLIMLSLVFYKIESSENRFLYTTDANDYNSEKYPLPLTVFPPDIPAECEIVSFSYYNDWHEAVDYYLELKFDSKEKLEAYISDLTSQKNKELFFEEQNIYRESFVDLFFGGYVSESHERIYTGYSVRADLEPKRYECNFGVISYSFEELTVIHSHARGWFREGIHDHIPEYFVSFNVPLDENHERIFQPKTGDKETGNNSMS